MSIEIPGRFLEVLSKTTDLKIGTEASLHALQKWFEVSRLPFFPDYTDHGPKHIHEVLATAEQLVAPETWSRSLLTPQDVAVFIIAVALHDSAMHLTEDGFLTLLSSSHASEGPFQDIPWPILWRDFLKEVHHLPSSKCLAIFGTPDSPQPPDLTSSPSRWTEEQRRLIGEFIRRHHHRLAHEIAQFGFPGVTLRGIVLDEGLGDLLQLSGFVARSHGMDLRTCIKALEYVYQDKISPLNCHSVYLMVLLRIADFIQIQSSRASMTRLRIQALRSPISKNEWDKHAAIKYVSMNHPDPESLYVSAHPGSARIFLDLKRLLTDLQAELDSSWAVLGEIYGRFGSEQLNQLGIKIRRVHSNLDDEAFLRTLPFVPTQASFGLATADLLKLMIRPLYGDNPAIAIRELVQNACDAVLESRFLQAKGIGRSRQVQDWDVAVRLERSNEGCEVLIVSDTGIGMTRETVQSYFLKAGASSRTSTAWKSMFESEMDQPQVIRSGRFGVGALACFLLGEEFEVCTRYMEAEQEAGLEFMATLDTENIELRRRNLPIGTTITVPLSPAVASELRDNEAAWDWWCLDSPRVDRYIDKELISQRYHLPRVGEALPLGWRRLRYAAYDDIAWTFRSDVPAIALNGIELRGAGGGIVSFQADDSIFSLNVGFPKLSIFDSRGHLPLRLDRSGLAVSRFPFEDELMSDVAHDVIAHSLVNAPSTVPGNQTDAASYFDGHEALVSPNHVGYGQRSIWYCTSSGIGICESWSLAEASIRRLFIVSLGKNGSPPPFVRDLVEFPNSAVVFIMSKSGPCPHWFRSYIMGNPLIHGSKVPSGIGRNVRVLKRIVFQHRSSDIISSSSADLKLQRMGDWMALSSNDKESEDEPYNVVTKIGYGKGCVGEWLLEPVAERRESMLSNVWLKCLGSPIIPFGTARREQLIAAAGDLTPYLP